MDLNVSNLNKYRVGDGELYNMLSYGEKWKTGKFYIPYDVMSNLLIEKNIYTSYALVEVKSEYYKLMFDIDLKENKEYSAFIKGKEDEITNLIISNINYIIEQTIVEPNLAYVFCDKNIGEGIHLYYPEIIVDKYLHQYIQNKVFDKCVSSETIKLDDWVWNKVCDKSVAKANGLRLPYFEVDGGYYKLNEEKSTYKFPENKIEKIKLCMINTEIKKYNFVLKITDDEFKHLFDAPVKKPKNNKKTVIVKGIKNKKTDISKQDDIQINELEYMDLGDKKQLCIDLLNILNVKRIDDHKTWLSLVLFAKNYGLYNEIIEISKKSIKFNTDAITTIYDLFHKTTDNDKILTFGSLIYWAKEDDYIQCMNIMRKHNMNVKLVIKKSDDILMYNANVKYNFEEDSKYISEAALKDIFMNIISGTRIFILHSPTGSGKTTIILRIIKFYGKNMIAEDITLNDINILSIVSRRSMSGAHQHAFAELKLKSYLDDPTEENKQIRSLEHLAQLKKTYSIVILDEINSLISHFYSQTMNGKRRASFVNLCRIISNASLIIACDANITLLTLNFFTPKIISNNDVYHYRNRYKNKQNINMMMYYSDEGTETAKIKEFCKLIKDDVEKKNSVLIFSDSKDIGTLIESILSTYNIDKNYIKLINKDHGTIEEITKFNDVFVNKCAISSPKIIYGVDILINYDAIFCVYKYTSNCNSMGALEYHQQYLRARNTKAVKILILDPYYEKRYNNFVCYEENKNKETTEYEIIKKNHQMMAKKYNLIDDLCSYINMNGISIDITSIFADIHFAKTWFDALFTTNKFQLVKLLAEEAGYNITAHKLNVIEDGKGHGKAVKNDKILVNSICSQIYDTESIDSLSEDKKRIGYNQYEQINMRSKLLGMQFTKEQKKRNYT